ncbi:hypothetical protein B9Z55_014664 [Caenorhabditis nigoni]|nr:hypothetical protein B9Z55_014664 [Caenorhabditis nigoni]
MGNKSKKKREARKRLLSNSKTNEDLEVSLQKKQHLDDSVDIVQADNVGSAEKDKPLEILPTRELIGNQLVAAIRDRQFAIVEGPLGCGKTFLGRYASSVLGLPIHVMQMGDQIDSKTLFGSYYCTEVAGQFWWTESTFAKWLQAPGVILLEDIDAANADVILKIVEVVTSRQADASNSEKKLDFHNEVRIIATMSGKGKKTAVLDRVPVRIRVKSLSDDELKRLASKSYPRVAHLSRTLISTFREIESVPGTGNSRQLTSTDFLRGCSRLALLPDIFANVETFAELIDTWCLADPKQRADQLCNIVASSLNVNPDRVNTHLSVRQPEVKYNEHVVSVGRSKLPRKMSMIKTGRHRLGHTRDVVQLMERICVCVSHNEPLLLVGETGVGKTSIVQAVSDLIGVTLDVVNVSPTSDSDELIQGYKPTTIGRLMEPFTKFYMEVFTENFDSKNNQKFVDNLEKCLSSGRFKDYLSLVEATAMEALQRKGTNKDERWAELLVRARQIRDGLEKGSAPFALQKCAVLEAAEKGHWLLVDEINLAPPECLDAIVNALSAPGTHPNFRLFACMNPATDAGKRRLPPGVRTRFTEFFVSETSDPFQLALIVSAYLPTVSQPFVENLVKFYISAKQLYPSRYSLRTLCRALNFTADNMFGSVDQSVYEAVSMAFLTNLESEEEGVMRSKIQTAFRCEVGVMAESKDDAASSAMSNMIRFIYNRIRDYDEQQTLKDWTDIAMKEMSNFMYTMCGRNRRYVSQLLAENLNNIEKLDGFKLMEKLQLVFIFNRPVSDEFVQLLKDAKFEVDLDNNRISRFSTEDGSTVRYSKSYIRVSKKRKEREQDGGDERPKEEEEVQEEMEEARREQIDDIEIEREQEEDDVAELEEQEEPKISVIVLANHIENIAAYYNFKKLQKDASEAQEWMTDMSGDRILSVKSFKTLLKSVIICLEQNAIRSGSDSITLESILKQLSELLVRPLGPHVLQEASDSIIQKIREVENISVRVPPSILERSLENLLMAIGCFN